MTAGCLVDILVGKGWIQKNTGIRIIVKAVGEPAESSSSGNPRAEALEQRLHLIFGDPAGAFGEVEM